MIQIAARQEQMEFNPRVCLSISTPLACTRQGVAAGSFEKFLVKIWDPEQTFVGKSFLHNTTEPVNQVQTKNPNFTSVHEQ